MSAAVAMPSISSQSFATIWQHPKAVLATADGRVTIGSNNWGGGLEQWQKDGQGNYHQVWSQNPGRVRGLTALSDGRICATVKAGPLTATAYEIHVYDVDGRLLHRWGEFGEEPGQLCNPAGIAVDAEDRLYIVETTEWNGARAVTCNRVQVFTAEGKYLRSWGSTGSEPGQFNLPIGITVAPDQSVWVADTYNSRLQRFSLDGELLTCWGRLGAAVGRLNCPQGMVVQGGGMLLVADTYNNRIQCFTQDGTPVWSWGWRGTDANCCWLPCAVAVDSAGRVLVADTMNHRILILEVGA